MNDTLKCTSCGKDVVPEKISGKLFCPECGNEIMDTKPAPAVPAPAKDTPSSEGGASANGTPGTGASIKDGMGIIENSRNKVGAVESFSDNSVTNNTTTNTTNNTTTNISNITQIEDDTKKSVVCEISGKRVLVTSSVKCPVCGRTVSNQYYDEAKLRCTACEKKAVAEYERFFKEMASGSRTIDKELRSVLDNKALELKLTDGQVKETELKIRKSFSGKDAHLSEMKQKDLMRTLSQFLNARMSIQACLNKVEAYAKVTDDEFVQCWYHLLLAVARPEAYRKALAEATVDEYWRIYWDFAAAVRMNKTAEAVNAIDLAKEKYPEKINDMLLAQILLEQCQFFITQNEAYLDDAQEDAQSLGQLESECLGDFSDGRIMISMLIVAGEIPPEFLKGAASAQQKAQSDTPRQAQRPQQTAQRPSQTQRPAQSPQAAQKPQQQRAAGQAASASKGVVLNNTAGGPLNPEVSFGDNGKGKGKGKGGLIAAVIVAVIIAGGIGFIYLKGGKPDQTPAQEASVPMQEIVPAEKPSAPAVMEESKPKTMAEKAKVKEEEKQTMAQKRSASEGAPASSGAGAADFAKAMEAYGKEDYKTAYDLFKKAGTAGNADACYQLGLMLSTGKGSISKNLLQAKVWMKKAASLGNADAQAALDAM